MPDPHRLAERFEANRAHLHAVAYRMLGSTAEAEDAVQDAWLRLVRSDADGVDNLGGWLTTVVARLCLDRLRARASRREDLLELRLPDPVVAFDDDGDPEREAILADTVGLALLVVLDTLTPAERLAFVLHDTFGLPFEQIGRILERTPTAARQLASRARRRVRGARAAPSAPPGRQRELVDAFLSAAREGDFAALVRVLDPEAVVRAETGERAGVLGRHRVIRGADAVAREALGFGRLAPGARHAMVNGTPGLVVFAGNAPFAVLGFTVRGDRIAEIDIIAAPERLGGLGHKPPA